MAPSMLLVGSVLIFVTVAAHALQSNDKLVRISIGKVTSKQAGDLGQPVTGYYANIDIGKPPKPFKVLIDINARELWVPHYLKLGIVYPRLNYKNGYSKKDSQTSVKEQAEVYKIDYKGTELSGKAYRDQFELKNITESARPVKYEQRFLAISSASNDKFTRFDGIDGVLPLSAWPISETGSDITTTSLYRVGLISGHTFALSLDPDLATTNGGEMSFGGVNPSKYVGDIKYHQVVSQHSWELSLHSVMLGASSIGDCQARPRSASGGSSSSSNRGGGIGEPCTVLLSTTTNDIFGPANAIKSIYKLLGVMDESSEFKANELREIDCLKVATAPMLTFIIDGAYYLLAPTSYIKKKVDGLIFKSETCYVALLSNGSSNKWELGTNFLTNYYTVFNQTNKQVGFGIRK